jgi:DNA-binding NtrC family response regulator
MTSAAAKKPRLLLVEDEPSIASVCARILAADGVCVDIARDGQTAREMAGDTAYDVCLTDIRVPGMSGTELYRCLEQENPALADRVIFTTGDTLSANTGDFLRESKRPFLAKPFTPDDLRRIVHETLEPVTEPIH